MQRQAAAAGSFDDQIGLRRRGSAVLVLVADRLDPHRITRCGKRGRAGARADLDIRALLDACARDGFEQRARHAENVEAEIAPREWIEPGTLHPQIQSVADFHGARLCQIVCKSGKQSLQGLQPAGEQHMGMLALRRSSSRSRLCRKHVALNDRDFPEMLGDRLRGSEAGHAGTNDHGMTSCRIWHVLLPSKGSKPKLI